MLIDEHQTKPTIMILGSGRLVNPGMDGSDYKMDDVLAPKRQCEIKQLVEQFKAFNPITVALEVDFSRNAEINAEYQGYLKGTYQLTRGEGNQIGYRLAKQLGHSKVYYVDYFRSSKENPKARSGLGDPKIVSFILR